MSSLIAEKQPKLTFGQLAGKKYGVWIWINVKNPKKKSFEFASPLICVDLLHRVSVPGEFPAQRPVTRSFDVFFDLRLSKRLRKQSWGWWFEPPTWSLWRQCNDITVISSKRHRSLYHTSKKRRGTCVGCRMTCRGKLKLSSSIAINGQFMLNTIALKSLVPGRWGCNRQTISKSLSKIDILTISCEITRMEMPQDFTDD